MLNLLTSRLRNALKNAYLGPDRSLLAYVDREIHLHIYNACSTHRESIIVGGSTAIRGKYILMKNLDF